MLFTLQGSVYYLSHSLSSRLITRYGIILLVSCLFLACGTYVPVKELGFIVRDGCNMKPLANINVVIMDERDTIKKLTTNAEGYAYVKLKDIKKIDRDSLDKYTVEWFGNIPESGGIFFNKDQMPLNVYLHNYDLYLVDTVAHPNGTCSISMNPSPTADMHYHISTRTHNYFGEWLYPKPDSNYIPPNLNWYKSYKKLKVLTVSEHGRIHIEKMGHTPDEDNSLKFLESQINAYDKAGSNKFTQFTQATNPHLLEGNVQLGYNAISPHEVANLRTWRNRLAANLFVTGARPAWMKRIAQKNTDVYTMTHWKNFNLEYQMITQQDRNCNNFHWTFLDTTNGLQAGVPTIVLAVEGSHILQDTLFPNFVNYNLGKRTPDNNIELIENVLNHKFPDRLDTVFNIDSAKFSFIRDTIGIDTQAYLSKHKGSHSNSTYKRFLPYLNQVRANRFIDTILSDELVRNIDSLKKMYPPICMMNISHLAYNGMTGHASAWDQGGFINNLIARRNYGLRVSDDPSYKHQWEAGFFSVPGVNQFGKLVFNKLLDTTNGHRILIDLKHSGPSTREFFFDSVMIPRVMRLPRDTIPADTIFPICSHCAVNGFPRMYGSPFVNEYNITRAPFVHTFYPFALNIYDEEITQICQNNGIIGIPLEQKILGSYINKMETRSPAYSKSGEKKKVKHQQIKRWNYVKRCLRYLYRDDTQLQDPILEDALINSECYSKKMLGIMNCDSTKKHITTKDIMKVTYRDYKSAEPFLYNVFHVIDKSYKQKLDAWKHICIGSDMDGLVDPIDICPTASQYPKFKERLKQFIPIFLKLRQVMNLEPTVPYNTYNDYFDTPSIADENTFTVDNALDQLFYQSLFDFTKKRMLQKPRI